MPALRAQIPQVLLGAALGAAAATYSARAPVATLGVGGGNMRRKDLKDLEEGEEITDEMRAAYIKPQDRIHPVTGERVRGGQWRLDRAGSARINELTKAGIEITDEAALAGPYVDKNKTRHPGHAAIQKPNKKWSRIRSRLNNLVIFPKLREARSRLYRRQIFQDLVNIRWKALDEIYKMYILLHRSDLKISTKNRQHVFANEY